ncbi:MULTISPECIES: phosphoribosylglycinamide formyltransferase [Cyanophyceae]|uniref:phosphoribosylglycinamide formyltransferase n=1 Tax=Cyanophyceae TaxID=3028117 RepID=UPI00016DC500|nr:MULTISPECIES: phosphoribosylglycinamide formyltransferase [Cyanophyceae]ACA98025.1 phosphoribosylglycinamide formyltransferase [Picosynechococcus sp. PCC 7002]SMH42240.1 formyltetrahydrofolate-dependent phosphoribosylglycinamide formyltransferase [Picosynechococcus sp. OG1]SMQ78727.1 formyltetrahydrofolate-dependent phosphoribosylglycinamide formyltransferase [Synechococcus sp. 7002]
MGNVTLNSALISPPVTLADVPLSRPVKLGVLASGSGSNYGAIAKAMIAKELNAEIPILIYNNPKAKVLERAATFGTKTQLINHRDFASREACDQAILDCLRAHGVEWVIMAGWMRIVTDVLLTGYENRILNIHPSLLPSFKGIRAVEQALAAGVKVTGCSVHFASPEVDSGDIIMQAVVPILADDTPETLHARIQVQEHRIFPAAIALAVSQYS